MTVDTTVDWMPATQQIADSIRRRVLENVVAMNGGYMSQACSAAEIFAMLYGRVLNIGPSTAPMIPRPFEGVPGTAGANVFNGSEYNGPRGPELDRFIFSPAHYAVVLYATLIEVGRLDADVLSEHYNVDGGTLEMIGAEHSPGIESTTGSLAQALSQASGIAKARKIKGETGDVWVMMSDGEFQEGQTWEAIGLAAWMKLDNLRVIVDVNGQQCDGAMENLFSIEPLAERIASFGAQVADVDGHDLAALDAAMTQPIDGPLFVLARTNPAQGLPIFAERAPLLHYLRFSSPEERERYAAFYQEMVNHG